MAAGTGERMNSEIPKQFMEINGLPIIIHTYKLFKEIGNLNIYIVLPSLDFEKWHKYISEFIFAFAANIPLRNSYDLCHKRFGHLL